jgi:hypothetical protein
MNNDDLVRALNRNSEIVALSLACQGKPTCTKCGLFATVSYLSSDGVLCTIWKMPGASGSILYPNFCNTCKDNISREELDPQDGKFFTLPGAQAATRLNVLLRGGR